MRSGADLRGGTPLVSFNHVLIRIQIKSHLFVSLASIHSAIDKISAMKTIK